MTLHQITLKSGAVLDVDTPSIRMTTSPVSGSLRELSWTNDGAAQLHYVDVGEVAAVTSVNEKADRPTIAVLCGSTRQRADFERLNKELTLAFKIVLSVGYYGHEDGLDQAGALKVELDALHLQKIALADEVHVIYKPDGTLGESTSRELDYAERLHKRVFKHHAGDGHG